MKAPEVATQLRDLGAEPVVNSPEDFAQAIKNDVKRWRNVVEKTGLKLQ
nr:tripartite tricarboxylate transporter substrate-binding protein [Comamonas sp. NoAH]